MSVLNMVSCLCVIGWKSMGHGYGPVSLVNFES